MVSRLSSTTVLRPSATQYLHAISPDQPAPMTITAYAWFRVSVSMSAAQLCLLELQIADGKRGRVSARVRLCRGVGSTRADGRGPTAATRGGLQEPRSRRGTQSTT